MKKFFSCFLAAVSVFGFSTFSYHSKAEEIPEQKVQETKEVKDTEVVFIIDQSGSMSPLRDSTVNSFNEIIEEQKAFSKELLEKNKAQKENGKTEERVGQVYVTTIFFNSKCTKNYDGVNIEKIEKMTTEDYKPNGLTALWDAVGGTLSSFKDVKDRNMLFVIITDGCENASKEYSNKQVIELIEFFKNAGHNFMYCGAGIDAVSEGAKIGIPEDMTFNAQHSVEGMKCTFDEISARVKRVRLGQ